MNLPEDIVERIRAWVLKTPMDGLHVDEEAARYGGISLMGTIGSTWLLRPDGTFWDVDDDFGGPLQPLEEEHHVTALVAGCERHPWLAPLLPVRPFGAEDCRGCDGLGRVYLNGANARDNNFFYCPNCRALGWITNDRI